MKSIYLVVLIFFTLTTGAFSQCDTYSVYSKVFNKERSYSVYLPENDSLKGLPIIYVLDDLGAMTFGINKTNTKFGRGIDAIVVEIHSDDRWDDFAVYRDGGFSEKSDLTRRFLAEEFFPMIDSTFAESNYRVAVGHSLTAFFWNSFASEHPEHLNALISCSPFLPDGTVEKLNQKYDEIGKELKCYLSYAEDDLSGHEKSYKSAPKKDDFSSVSLKVDRISNSTHTTLLPQSIHNGLVHIFFDLMEIDRLTKKESKQLLKDQGNNEDLLEDYYKNIARTYNLTLPYRKYDIVAVPFLIQKWGEPEELKAYCDKHLKERPEIWQLYFYRGEYYENLKQYDRALSNFQKGYDLMIAEGITLNTSDFKEDIIRIKKKMAKQ